MTSVSRSFYSLAALVFIFSLIFSPLQTTADSIGSGSVIPDFKLQIPFPDLAITGGDFTSGTAIGKYVKAAYKWAVAAASILAVLVFMYGGFLYLTARGDKTQVGAGQKVIQNALAGLILTLGSYVFLYSINPNLVEFRDIKPARVTPLAIYEDKGGRIKEIILPLGAKNCLTPGLTCEKHTYCDPIKNECVKALVHRQECTNDKECEEGFSCLPDATDGNKMKCLVNTISAEKGICCRLDLLTLPEGSTYETQTQAVQEKNISYRECQLREQPPGTTGATNAWAWCKTNDEICADKKTDMQGNEFWQFNVDAMKQRNVACYAFIKGHEATPLTPAP